MHTSNCPKVVCIRSVLGLLVNWDTPSHRLMTSTPEGWTAPTHLLLVFFLLGAFFTGTTGTLAALGVLALGVLAILAGLGCLMGSSSSSTTLLCFSFSTFFFFFLSFLSFFFLGLTMGPWESAVSCSWTAFS